MVLGDDRISMGKERNIAYLEIQLVVDNFE